jgi:hypothetical protein
MDLSGETYDPVALPSRNWKLCGRLETKQVSYLPRAEMRMSHRLVQACSIFCVLRQVFENIFCICAIWN